MPTIHRQCPLCSRENSTELTKNQWDRYLKWLTGGTNIQDALYDMPAADRETIRTGICDPCFETL